MRENKNENERERAILCVGVSCRECELRYKARKRVQAGVVVRDGSSVRGTWTDAAADGRIWDVCECRPRVLIANTFPKWKCTLSGNIRCLLSCVQPTMVILLKHRKILRLLSCVQPTMVILLSHAPGKLTKTHHIHFNSQTVSLWSQAVRASSSSRLLYTNRVVLYLAKRKRKSSVLYSPTPHTVPQLHHHLTLPSVMTAVHLPPHSTRFAKSAARFIPPC